MSVKTTIFKAIQPLRLQLNRLRGKTFIPSPFSHLYIETTNICNLNCRFCAYGKQTRKKGVMSYEKFVDIIDKATAYGYRRFGLTPIVGEVFADKGFMKKLSFLEGHDKVQEYSFYSNFILPDSELIESLSRLKKLKTLGISIYGHDLDSHCLIARSSERNYRKLSENIESLRSVYSRVGWGVEFWLRSSRGIDQQHGESQLLEIIRLFCAEHDVDMHATTEFNNWGGLIVESDVAGIDMDVVDGSEIYKNGACSLIFYKNQVLVDGRLNACACRDVNGTMVIGDLNAEGFAEIFSGSNCRYMDLIQEQQRGVFKSACFDCDFYRSIYSYYGSYDRCGGKLYQLKDFQELFDRNDKGISEPLPYERCYADGSSAKAQRCSLAQQATDQQR